MTGKFACIGGFAALQAGSKEFSDINFCYGRQFIVSVPFRIEVP
jgi:hypothetical protein